MKYTFIGIAVVVVLGAITYLGMTNPKYENGLGVATSTSGATYNTAHFAAVVADLRTPGTTGTSTSVYNSDSTDRYVTGIGAGCQRVGTSQTAYTGAGLAALALTVGTTSAASPAIIPSSLVVASSWTIATATTMFSTTTPLNFTTGAGIWPSGTYMTFWANATNTAFCTFGVSYFGA